MGKTVPNPSLILALLKGFYWYEDSVRNYVRSRGREDFTHSQSMLITHVMLGYRRPSDIARQLGISRQAVHVTIGQMVRKGILKLEPDPANRHIRQVTLTANGERMRKEGLEGMAIATDELSRRIGKANVSKIAQILATDWGQAMTFKPEASKKVRGVTGGA